jgi:formylglycine-generating enzyme required for sulfatase activity
VLYSTYGSPELNPPSGSEIWDDEEHCDPSGQVVARGGSFLDEPQLLNVTRRYPYPPNTVGIELGFRCCRWLSDK